MKYLFSDWNKVKERLENKHLFIFLDYDGTLTPIVTVPDKAILSIETRELLKMLSENLKLTLAVISGRTLRDIRNKIGIRGIIYGGNHGLELEARNIKIKSQAPQGFKTVIRQIKDDLKKKLLLIKGVFIEDKNLTLSVHYRLAAPGHSSLIKRITNEVAKPYLGKRKIKLSFGKKVIEIKPPVKWDKGKAVLWLLSNKQFSTNGGKVLPVYIGDDVTDEDAFEALEGKGLTIFVGRQGNSHAEYYLKNTGEVTGFLKQVLEMKRV